jgi:hypothetical protein
MNDTKYIRFQIVAIIDGKLKSVSEGVMSESRLFNNIMHNLKEHGDIQVYISNKISDIKEVKNNE